MRKNKNLVIVGIDPGNKGALSIVRYGFYIHAEFVDMPVLQTKGKGKTKKGNDKIHTELDALAIKQILIDCAPSHVFIEKAQSMPGQGLASTANYMSGFGLLKGICVGLGIPFTLVHPATWKKQMLKDMDKGKGSAILRAKQVCPEMANDIGKNDGRAEALLIALYGRKEFL